MKLDDSVAEVVTGSLQDLFGKPTWPPTYPHVPGIPCPDCGWDGKPSTEVKHG